MTRKDLITVTAILIEEQEPLAFEDVCSRLDLDPQTLLDMVEEGLLEPRGPAPQQWRFTPAELARLRTALTLQRDLGVNLAGAGLALELLEELRVLRRRVRLLEQQFRDDF